MPQYSSLTSCTKKDRRHWFRNLTQLEKGD